MAQPSQTLCPLCKGNKVIGQPPNAQLCPLCDGSGKNPDAGVFYVLPMPDFDLVTINVVGATPPAINLPDNRPFKWVALTGSGSQGNFSIQLTDSSSQYTFMQSAVPSPLIVGTAQQPFVLPTPYLFIRQIQITLGDLSGIAHNHVNLAFIGALIS